jgi:NAD(P)-dependent dehydrogenase (short-subunit alcohol dehydrogenase family)
MIEKEIQGRIINISSIGGKKGVPGHAHYSASKFGLIGLTQCLARELATYKITVNAVCPGRIVTNIRDRWLRERAQRLGITIDEARANFYEEKSAVIPLKRPGEVDDIAGIVAFLASIEADFITGQSINVDGGELMEH